MVMAGTPQHSVHTRPHHRFRRAEVRGWLTSGEGGAKVPFGRRKRLQWVFLYPFRAVVLTVFPASLFSFLWSQSCFLRNLRRNGILSTRSNRCKKRIRA